MGDISNLKSRITKLQRKMSMALNDSYVMTRHYRVKSKPYRYRWWQYARPCNALELKMSNCFVYQFVYPCLVTFTLQLTHAVPTSKPVLETAY